MDLSTDLSIDCQAETTRLTLHIIPDQITETTVTPVTTTRTTRTTDRATTGTTIGTGATNRTRDTNRETKTTKTGIITVKIEKDLTTEGEPNKYQHHRNQHKAQIVFEFSDQNMMQMMQTVRGFINLIKANPTTRDQYKSNKLAICKEYDNEVNESEIHSSNLDQVQHLINEDTDLVFDALVAADYIDEIECADGTHQQQA